MLTVTILTNLINVILNIILRGKTNEYPSLASSELLGM